MSGHSQYAAFLRGVNLGPSNKIAMPRLRTMVEQLGFSDVRTVINSGNLVLRAKDQHTVSTVAQVVHQGIADEFGLDIDVAVRTAEQLHSLLADNPFPDGDPSRVTVAFLVDGPPAGVEERLAAAADEPYLVVGTEVWVHYTRGQGRSRLAAQFSRIIGASATVRNVRTVQKVCALLDR